jgi:copper chaperone NosL
MRTRLAIILAVVLLTTGCQAGEARPAAIDKDDVCALCKMAISEPRYAAQIVDKDGNNHKFDDIGCMLRFARDRKLNDASATFFVMDYESGKDWLNARQTTFVRSDAISSPMASRLGAFRSRSKAGDFSAKNKGQVLTFEELLNSKG